MNQLSLEIKFVEGVFVNQLWVISNLDSMDLLYHYEHLPMIYLRESVINVCVNEQRITIDEFLMLYNTNNMSDVLSH